MGFQVFLGRENLVLGNWVGMRSGDIRKIRRIHGTYSQ